METVCLFHEAWLFPRDTNEGWKKDALDREDFYLPL